MMTLINNRHGQQLAVYTFGDAKNPSIIFSNSLGTDYSMWQSQVAYFSKNYHVVCYDTRGHGKSSVNAHSTLNDLANDVVDIINFFKIKKAHFCGISMGGITGLQLALNEPTRFLSICIANSAAKIGQQDAWLSRADSVEKQGLEELVNTTHTRWFSHKFDYIHNNIAQQTIQSLSVTQPTGYAASCRALAYADLQEQISRIQIPCLVICGSLDAITTVADGEFIKSRIKDCELEILDASHLSNIEDSTGFNQVLFQFVTQR